MCHVAGDASVTTAWDMGFQWHKEDGKYSTAHLIHAVQPTAKIVAIFRNPTERWNLFIDSKQQKNPIFIAPNTNQSGDRSASENQPFWPMFVRTFLYENLQKCTRRRGPVVMCDGGCTTDLYVQNLRRDQWAVLRTPELLQYLFR